LNKNKEIEKNNNYKTCNTVAVDKLDRLRKTTYQVQSHRGEDCHSPVHPTGAPAMKYSPASKQIITRFALCLTDEVFTATPGLQARYFRGETMALLSRF